MGLRLKKPYNKLNVIIRAEEGEVIFYSDVNDCIKKIKFNIYSQGFEREEKYIADIGFSYLDENKDNDKEISKNVKVFSIGKYEISKNGFTEQDIPSKVGENTKQIKKTRKVRGITDNFISDLKLTFENIELKEGLYELYVRIDNLMISTYPFEIKKKVEDREIIQEN